MNIWRVSQHKEPTGICRDSCVPGWATTLNLVPGVMLDMIYSEFLIMPLPQIKSCYSMHLIGVEILPNMFGAC